MSSPKRNTKKTGSQNKSIKTKKNIKYKTFTKNSVQSNKSQFYEQSEQVKNAKEILMMQSERFQEQHGDYGFARSHYQGCSTFDKQSNGDWGTEMIQQIQITKREQLLRKQKIISEINKNITKQKQPQKVPEQIDCKNNHERQTNKQIIETQINKLLKKQKQSFENEKNINQKDLNKDKEVLEGNYKRKEIKKVNINTKFDIFNGTRVKVRQKNIQPQCFGLSQKQVVFDSKIFTQKTMALQKNCTKNQQQADKKKTIQYIALSKSRGINHRRTCSQNNSYLALKKQKNIPNPQQSMGSDRKLSQMIYSTSYQPFNSKWIKKQFKNNPILIKQSVNPHTFCIKQMVASFINKKQSQNKQKTNNQKIFKQLVYKPIQFTKNKKQKMKQLRHRVKHKSREEKHQYFTHSLTNSQSSYESKEQDKKQIKIKNMHFQLENKQEIVFKVQNLFNKTKTKDREADKNRTQDKSFQKRSELLLKNQNRIKTEPEMTKITNLNPYMLKIIQIQQKYKQKIELSKLDIKNVFLS